MFKIGKAKETNSISLEIFFTNGFSSYYDEVGKKTTEEYKEINFNVTGNLDTDSYNLTFMFNGPVEKLLELEKHTNYDIQDFLVLGESFLGINEDVYWGINIKGNILRFSNNKFVIDITFNNEDNEYFGHIEFDFILDEYLNK